MDQQKIGHFLKELRNEKSITQEQLAEVLGVSNRSISRWENGVTMPDFDILIEIAKYFDVEIGEILDGGRKGENMDKKTEETLLKIADYNNNERMNFFKRLHYFLIAGLIAFIVYAVIEAQGLTDIVLYDNIASAMLGFVLGVLLVGVLYTSPYIMKIRAFKSRLLHREE